MDFSQEFGGDGTALHAENSVVRRILDRRLVMPKTAVHGRQGLSIVMTREE